MDIFHDLDECVTTEGSRLGPTDWMAIQQIRVNLFADATTIEVGGSEKPAAVIESIVRYVR